MSAAFSPIFRVSADHSETTLPTHIRQQTEDKTVGYVSLLINTTSALSLIAINKHLFLSGFHYVGLLMWFNFALTTLCLYLFKYLGMFESKALPWKGVAKMSVINTIGIVASNMSLKYNSIGVYQLSKLLGIPFMVTIEYLWYNKSFSNKTLYALSLLIFSVALATVRDVHTTSFGLLIIGIAVSSQSIANILMSAKQKEWDASPAQLSFYQMHFNTLFMTFIIPLLDDFNDGWNIELSFSLWMYFFLSCIISGALNISTYFVVGIFSAITSAVSSQMKTVAVILIGIIFFDESARPDLIVGVTIALSSALWYSLIGK